MAGFFGMFDYSKEGKGVRKDEPEKTGAALFFELFKRKFWNYVKLSIMYAITCIPTFIYFLIAGMYLFQDFAKSSELSLAVITISSIVSIAAILFFSGSIFHPGFDYILRNYTRGEHAWIISDFFKHTKNNFKQSLCVYLIDLVILTLAFINLRFYIILLTTSGNNILPSVMIVIFAIMLYIYSVMHSYIGTMMVTFKLSLRAIYKNAFIFTVLGIKNNFISFAIRAAIFGIVFYYLNPPFAAVLYAAILIGATGLMSEIGVYPIIKKYMLDKVDSVEDENTEDENLDGDNNENNSDDETENISFAGPNDVASLFKNKNDVLEEPKSNDEEI